MLEHLGEKLILHIPVGGLTIDVDLMTMIMSWVVIALLVGLAFLLRRGLRQEVEEKPTRVQALLDGLIELLEGQFARNFASERLARDLFPFVSTLFLFVLFSNWLSVIPYLQSPTQNLNVTLGFAVLVLFLAQALAIRAKGLRKYLASYAQPYPFILPLNIVGEFGRTLSHAFRLFGNIFGGAILIAVVTDRFAPVVVPAGLNAFFGLFVGAVQAFVFALLAVAYINVSVES